MLKDGPRPRSELNLHPVAGELGSRQGRIGAIEHGFTMLRAKRAEVNQDKTAYLGLGSQLSYWRDVAVTDLSDEFRAIIQIRAFRKQHVAPPDVVCIAGTRLALRAWDMATGLFDSGSKRSQGRV